MVLVYVDVFNSQDEIIEKSTFNPQPVMDDEGNDTGLIIWHSKIVSKGGDDVDIGCGNAFGGDAEEDDADVEKVNNCIDEEKGFGYNAMPFGTKAELKDWCKSYFGKLRKHYKTSGKDDEFMTDFKAKAQRAAKWLLVNFKECSAYAPKSFETENALIFEFWDDEANTSGAPAFVAFEPGLNEVKY